MDLLELRKLHGSVLVSRLPSGQDIPWRPLSVQEYMEYDKLLKVKKYASAYIEDEIFRKCVLSKIIIDNIDNLRAGIICTVVLDILNYSGPSNLNDLEQLLNASRSEANQVIHQLVSIVCQAFPAYKPEDLYSMNYSVFCLRVAQAEEKLLRTNLLSEPLSFLLPGEENTQQEPLSKPEPQVKSPPPTIEEHRVIQKIDLKNQYNIQKAQEAKNAPGLPSKTNEQTIIRKADIIEHESTMSAHDRDIVEHNNATKETANIYSDYIQQLKDGKKIKIKTDEERIEASSKREAKNKEELLKAKEKILKEMAVERKELLKIREKERARRKMRNNRK